MKKYIIRSKMYSDDPREFNNLDEVRRYIKKWYPEKVGEVYVFSKTNRQYGNVLFNGKGSAFWFTPRETFYIRSDGSLGKKVAVFDKKINGWRECKR